MRELIGIVLQKKRIRDRLILVRIFSESQGLKTYWWSAGSKSMQAFDVFDTIRFQSKEEQKDQAQWLKTPQTTKIILNARIHPVKSATLLFFQEILMHLLTDGYQNPPLFYLIQQIIQDIDETQHEQPLQYIFLVGLMKALGCCPIVSNEQADWFNINEGQFGQNYFPPGKNILPDNNQLYLFQQLIQGNWESLYQPHISASQRREIMKQMVDYIFIKSDKTSPIKSLEIFYELFHL
jgi:recombinational DNA repair protein (RecF pathway)